MQFSTENSLIEGAVGPVEVCIEHRSFPRGIAVVAHPHPLGGGTNANKVTYSLARALLHLDYAVYRPNFRGVGNSVGEHDQGEGETEDLLLVLSAAQRRFGAQLPVVLAGFSFGAYCQARVAERLAQAHTPVQRLILVGTAVGSVPGEHHQGGRHYPTPQVPAGTIIIHGSDDTTVPLANVLEWAEPQNLPVVVIPGADHFFHRRLNCIREVLQQFWREHT